jgi:hypothetical protein
MMTFGGIHAYHVSRTLRDIPFAALIFAAIYKADTANLDRLRIAFPELVEEIKARHNARLGAIPDDQIEDMEALAEQVDAMMADS